MHGFIFDWFSANEIPVFLLFYVDFYFCSYSINVVIIIRERGDKFITLVPKFYNVNNVFSIRWLNNFGEFLRILINLWVSIYRTVNLCIIIWDVHKYYLIPLDPWNKCMYIHTSGFASSLNYKREYHDIFRIVLKTAFCGY